MTDTYRESLSPEDRKVYDEMRKAEAENRAYNTRVMDEAGVPRPARRGFYAATSLNGYRIREITEHPREGGKRSRWSCVTEMYEGSYTTYGWLIGPRGAAKKIW